MFASVFIAIATMLTAALTFPTTGQGLENRQHLNTDWIITGWTIAKHGPQQQRTASFAAGAPDAYIDGFNGFTVRCENIPYDSCNYTLCEDLVSYRVEAKVSEGSGAGLTNLSLIHTQIEPDKLSIASGSGEVMVDNFFELAPTEVRVGTAV